MATDIAKILKEISNPTKELLSRQEVINNPDLIPAESGIDAWFFKSIRPIVPTEGCKTYKGKKLLYVGISGDSRKRITRDDLKGNVTTSTLRHSLGALLSKEDEYELTKSPKGHLMLTNDGEKRLNGWMDENAFVLYLPHEIPKNKKREIRRKIIKEITHTLELPLPLNLQDNEDNQFGETLSALRKVEKTIESSTEEREIISEERRNKYKKPNKTERKGLVTSRIGQGFYRDKIIKKWERKCAISGIDIPTILIASHIVPWSESTNEERLDVENGILLSPLYDALFDRHLISFDKRGKILISSEITEEKSVRLGLSKDIKIELSDGMEKYMSKHRERLRR